jgi:hypothetical protein
MNPMDWKRWLFVAGCVAAWPGVGLAQGQVPGTLEVDLENFTEYLGDVADYSKLATDPNATTTTSTPQTFGTLMFIADIVAVNGKPARGTYVFTGQFLFLRTTPLPGQAISDIVRNGFGSETYEILQSNGTPVGTIMTSGALAGSAPPGSPSNISLG